MIQDVARAERGSAFPGRRYVLFGLATVIFFYGGWPFLKGLFEELRQRQPGHDDADRPRHQRGLCLQQRRGVRPARRGLLLGTGHPDRHHAARALDRDAVGHGRVAGAGEPRAAHARRGPPADAPAATRGCAGQRAAARRPGAGQAGREGPDRRRGSSKAAPASTRRCSPARAGRWRRARATRSSAARSTARRRFTIEVQKTGEETYLAQVIEMVRQAQETRSRTQDLANRAALWLTIIALGRRRRHAGGLAGPRAELRVRARADGHGDGHHLPARAGAGGAAGGGGLHRPLGRQRPADPRPLGLRAGPRRRRDRLRQDRHAHRGPLRRHRRGRAAAIASENEVLRSRPRWRASRSTRSPGASWSAAARARDRVRRRPGTSGRSPARAPRPWWTAQVMVVSPGYLQEHELSAER